TNKRMIIQSGIIGRDFKSVDYDRMQNVSVDVGILGVIFKVGTVKIFTGEIETVSSGKTSSIQSKYDRLHYVSFPYDVLKKLQTELSKRKEQLA
ncbi:MAG: PH domain-containing protein, partial [Candidatus Woesearchaeota archaeon]|nr:PH domain-containing protein [Candidatus Woesearchaeota archaeon]